MSRYCQRRSFGTGLGFKSLLGVLALCGPAWAKMPLTPEAYQAAVDYFQQHAQPFDRQRFADHHADPRWQAQLSLLLGTTLLNGDTQLDSARLLLQNALDTKPPITAVSQRDASIRLGLLAEKQQRWDQAERHYRHAMAQGSDIACNYLGVLREHQQDYAGARAIYEACLPDRATPLLLLNLGTLYYNGQGVAQDRQQGAAYWQRSFAAFPYDADTNYNLGIYQQQIRHDEPQARYHLAFAAQLGDREAARKLQSGPLQDEDASGPFAAELQHLDRGQFNLLLDDRIFYLSRQTRITGETDAAGVTLDHCPDAAGLCVSGTLTTENMANYLRLAFAIYYVDDVLPLQKVDLAALLSHDTATVSLPGSVLTISRAKNHIYSFRIIPDHSNNSTNLRMPSPPTIPGEP